MKDIKVCCNPTMIHNRYMPFGGIYGTIDGYTYYVDHFHEGINRKNTLCFFVWSPVYNCWMRTSNAMHHKYDNLAKIVCKYIVTNKMWLRQPTPYVRNSEIAQAGAPKEKKAQNELIFKVPNVGYALSSRVTTETDPMRRIRPGVVRYYPA